MRTRGKKYTAARQQVPARPHKIEDAVPAVQEIKAGKVEFRVDKAGIVHAPIGKTSFTPDRLIANAHALMDSVVRAKPSAAKGKYLKSVTMSSTMGPGVTIDTSHVDELVKH